MKKYSPGNYMVTIRGTVGSQTTITTEVDLELSLVNPCPKASLSNLSPSPFEDVTYVVGKEEIS